MQTLATQLQLFSENDYSENNVSRHDKPGVSAGFSIRESGRAKRLSIKVFPRGRVEVVVPKRTRHQEVRAFVEAHRDWIRDTREKFAAEYVPEPFALPDVVRLPGIEREFAIVYQREVGATKVRHRIQGGSVYLRGKTDDDAQCVAALKRWLTRLAKKEYSQRLKALSDLTGNSYINMHVRGQRTCWGSHSSSGTISLNYCLLFLEPAELRYVMIHELCHARHMNHSARFWRHVAKFEPNYRLLDKNLNSRWKNIPTWVGIY